MQEHNQKHKQNARTQQTTQTKYKDTINKMQEHNKHNK